MIKRRTEWLKLVGINVLVFFVAANVFYWAIPTVTAISNSIRSRMPPRAQKISEDPVVTNRREALEAKLRYRSFVGWRGESFNGTTVTVAGPYGQRRTVNPASSNKSSSNKKAYFFGGSTMWGAGAPDAGTIPSQFSEITGIHSENFGERGWTAHQSLMLLIELIQEGHRPDLVIFYDGVNEVYFKCDRRHNANSHGWEHEIVALRSDPPKPNTFTHYFAPIEELAFRIQKHLLHARGEHKNTYVADCHQNPAKAKAIAENLIRDWQVAEQLVTAYGGRFVGVLQPVSFYSKTRVAHLYLDDPFLRHLKEQYDTIYPVLIERLANGGGYHNLVPVLDHDEVLYVDFCHLGPKGNRYVAQRLAEIVSTGP